jgi:hypothetical protein
MYLDDYVDAVYVLAQNGGGIPPQEWIESMRADAARQSLLDAM